MNKERLLNVARALRESPNPDEFDMGLYAHRCDTPACAWGHYCHRRDLQNEFMLDKHGDPVSVDADDKGCHRDAELFSDMIDKHFDLSSTAVVKLFGFYGCGNAQTAIEAAEYIERFVAEHEVRS